MCVSMGLCVYTWFLFIGLSMGGRSVYMFAFLSVSLLIVANMSMFLFVCLGLFVFVCLSVFLSLCLSVCLFAVGRLVGRQSF